MKLLLSAVVAEGALATCLASAAACTQAATAVSAAAAWADALVQYAGQPDELAPMQHVSCAHAPLLH